MPSDRVVEATARIGRRREASRWPTRPDQDGDRIAGRTYDSPSSARSWRRRPRRESCRRPLRALADRVWEHPIRGAPVRFAFSTLERWYYLARQATLDPVGRLRRRLRKDAGQQPTMGERLRQVLLAQYHAHHRWSYQLHVDNLRVLIEADPTLGPLPSYSTVRRYMHAQGLRRQRRRTARDRPGADRVAVGREPREVRSYEVEYVGGLWHADFHHGSLKILTASGQWVTPLLLAFLDDRSRLCCHAQWYLAETAQTFVHGFAQAVQKRGLPRALMTDNGSPMLAAETGEGLTRLSVRHETTLPYSPHQNAKQEVFWAQVEGRLLAMLEGVAGELRLPFLNEATQAWTELEYHRTIHAETKQAPLARFLAGPEVLRPSPSADALRAAFTTEQTRAQRRSDGTIMVEGVRVEVPARFAHLPRLTIRYARWDLTSVLLCERRTGTVLTTLYPLDKARNADAVRRPCPPRPSLPSPPATVGVAPLLDALLRQSRATALPPAYVPLHTDEEKP
jgi:putative transposase